MDHRYGLALLLLGVVAPVLCQQAQQTSQCVTTFFPMAMNCVQNASINSNHLTWIITNGSNGQMPPDGVQQFKLRACNARPQVDQCGQLITARLYNSTMCRTQADKKRLMGAVKGVFGEYDRICAHPCRYTLIEDMRQCFSYSNLDPRTFIDSAWGQGAVIGTNEDQVYQFCNNRRMLMQCIRQKTDLCPDAKTVFYEMGSDLLSMEKGIETLCQAPRVYLEGLRYFTNPNQDVQMCIQAGSLKMDNIKMLLQQTMNEQQFNFQTCSTRLEQVNCEISAYTRSHSDVCDKAIIGLRNELECKIMPDLCTRSHPQMYQRFCNKGNFHMQERTQCGSSAITWSLASILLVVLRFVIV